MSSLGFLGSLELRCGLGLLRLSTEGRPAEPDAIAIIHHALDRGIRLLDTADVYCLDEKDLHYGERLARKAVDTWHGPREETRIVTKAGPGTCEKPSTGACKRWASSNSSRSCCTLTIRARRSRTSLARWQSCSARARSPILVSAVSRLPKCARRSVTSR